MGTKIVGLWPKVGLKLEEVVLEDSPVSSHFVFA